MTFNAQIGTKAPECAGSIEIDGSSDIEQPTAVETCEADTRLTARFLAWLKEGIGKARRAYLSHLRPGYVRKMQELRRGECKRCGNCCSLFWRCPFIKDTAQCTLYENRFKSCRNFPIDARDITGAASGCGHCFVTEATARAEAEAASVRAES